MKKRDFILIAVLLIIAGAGYGIVQLTSHTGDQVIVTVDKQEVIHESLIKDQELEVPLTEGENTIQIKDGKVSMKAADCPDQICVRHKAISKSGESIVCLPHKVVVEIQSTGKSDVDIMTQ